MTLFEEAGPGQVYVPATADFLGVSRKYLIPFLEYCDRRGSEGVETVVF
jgi:hypothetical protein